MKPGNKQRLEELFDAGLNLENARAYLMEQVQDDRELTDELSSLWEHCSEAETLFSLESMEMMRRAAFPPEHEDLPEEKFKITRTIASGGMGIVYQAEQQYPIVRTVALKVLDTGRVSEELLSRFRFEGQVLALMEHPYIARVYDSGMTARNDPFIAMEYLDGQPITEYCDNKRLNIEERLRLFMKVCDGLQHAHQKGVIHRDIKPSNILVIDQDGQAVPKIIDFGIAKFTGESLVEKPSEIRGGMVEEPTETRRGMVMGTPHYMSPEQAAGLHGQIDTRTDLYSLGVVFYELLVGVIPLDQYLDKETSLRECCRIIQEVDPPAPSRRIDSDDSDFQTGAETRGLTSQQLVRRLSRDLDWIALKALSKSPADRYASCSQFNTDIRYHLENRPVIAGPLRQTTYHLRKFLRRYRNQVVTAALFMLMLLIGGAAFLMQERNARERASQINKYLIQLVGTFVPETSERNVLSIQALNNIRKEVNQVFRGDSLDEASFRFALGKAYNHLDAGEEAVEQHREALRIYSRLKGRNAPESLEVLGKLAMAVGESNRADDAAALYQEHVDLLTEKYGARHPKTLDARLNQAFYYKIPGNDRLRATELFRQCFEDSRYLSDEHAGIRMKCSTDWAAVLVDNDQYQEAAELFEKSIPGLIEHFGEDHHTVLYTQHNYANLFYSMDRLEEGIRRHRELLATRRAVLFPDSRRIQRSMHALAWGLRVAATRKINRAQSLRKQARALEREGQSTRARSKLRLDAAALNREAETGLEEAESLIREVFETRRKSKGLANQLTLESLEDLGLVLQKRGKLDEAIEVTAQIDELTEEQRLIPSALSARNGRAYLYILKEDYAAAEGLLEHLLDDCKKSTKPGPEGDKLTGDVLLDLARVKMALNKTREALTHFAEGMERHVNPNYVRGQVKQQLLPYLKRNDLKTTAAEIETILAQEEPELDRIPALLRALNANPPD
ncbi:MAG: serine/threonine-protein kinase [Acidobacteriota bacterium]|nr:serine/threonine-protein kinase [Acidobacteriota bacterium]